LARAKDQGAILGRPSALAAGEQDAVREALEARVSVSELARRYDTSRQTIMRVRDAVAASYRTILYRPKAGRA
jgi:putative DNA-invertase from lambdoid prophage Rac